MRILHISAECYPAAKAGGLGDVVGALPKYLNRAGISCGVIIPKYHTEWITGQSFRPVYSGSVRLHQTFLPFTIEQYHADDLGFPLYVADIPTKFDRPGIYADPDGGWYSDETERFICFQQAVLQWTISLPERPRLLHCHDHHVGLIPFLTKHGLEFKSLKDVPTVFTIHNAEYHGAFSWERVHLLPFFKAEVHGLLDWDGRINPLASAIRCAWHITTVSPSYLEELKASANGLEGLIRQESAKATGVLNGIDANVWNPRTDPLIDTQMKRSIPRFKKSNKQVLSHRFNIDLTLPVFTFIGRLVREKGADLLPDLISKVLKSGLEVAFIVLGTGEPHLHEAFREMLYYFQSRLDVALEYNEQLAHQLYAGSDFLLMPSRVEPCGLNQMYAMRYATVPVVRSVGGLRDTVPDIGAPDGQGRGIRFDRFNLDDAHQAVWRSYELFQNEESFDSVRQRIMEVDFSWENAANNYINIYNQLI
jgi:starch synthase